MSLSTILTHEYSWVTKHIFLLVVTAALVLGSVYGVENLISKHDVTEAARYAQIEAAQVAQTQALEKELAANEAHAEFHIPE